MKHVIGITGGVGSGKSTLLQMLQSEYGAHICMADILGHLAFEQGSETYDEIVIAFGTEITDPSGDILHDKLAEIVFNNDAKRDELNSIIHPFVIDMIKNDLEEWKTTPEITDPDIYVIETALLFETGCDNLCDKIWGVTCDKDIRIKRLMDSRGYSKEKSESIIETQISDDELKEKCNVIINNDGNISELKDQIATAIEMIKQKL